MATSEQMRALLSVTCSWCGAGPGQRCTTGGKYPRVPTTLDGESHDARWRTALGSGAQVLSAVVQTYSATPEPVGAVLTTALQRGRIECPY